MLSERAASLELNSFLVKVNKPDGERSFVCLDYLIQDEWVFFKTVDEGMVILNLNAIEDIVVQRVDVPDFSPKPEAEEEEEDDA